MAEPSEYISIWDLPGKHEKYEKAGENQSDPHPPMENQDPEGDREDPGVDREVSD